jgi:hypothetical protein
VRSVETLVQHQEDLATVLDDPSQSTVDSDGIRDVVELYEGDPGYVRRKEDAEAGAQEMNEIISARKPDVIDGVDQAGL